MVDCEKSEAINLVNFIYLYLDLIVQLIFQQKEFEWVLNEEIHKGLEQIHHILVVRIYK